MDDAAIAFLVTLHGEVQGIGLRKRIAAAARAYGVAGWVRNRKAGHVQAHFEGSPEPVRRIIADLQLQLIEAEITDHVISKATPMGHPDFRILKGNEVSSVLDGLIDAALDRARLLTQESRDLDTLLLEAARHKADDRADTLKSLAQEIPSRHLGEPMVQRQKLLAFPLADVVCSFASEAWSQKVMNRSLAGAGIRSAASLLDDKTNGQAFAHSIGLRVPESFQNDVQLDRVEPRAGIVVKPSRAASSKGVYCFFAEDRILDVAGRKTLLSCEEFFESARARARALNRGDRWMVEELILGPEEKIPNDMKYYCFYGQAHLVLEVDRSGPEFRYCWWTREGQRTETGKYADALYSGTALDPENVRMAESVSRKIPLPFIRIDFLESTRGPVFGEFTPKPGNFQEFDAPTDCWLGKCYVQARGRLMADIMKGKTFDEYNEFLATRKTSAQSPAA